MHAVGGMIGSDMLIIGLIVLALILLIAVGVGVYYMYRGSWREPVDMLKDAQSRSEASSEWKLAAVIFLVMGHFALAGALLLRQVGIFGGTVIGAIVGAMLGWLVASYWLYGR